MSEETTIYHLFGEGLSGRAVKLRELDPDDSDDIEAEAARAAKESGFDDSYDFVRHRSRMSLTRMIVAVTAKNTGVEDAKQAREAAVKAVGEAAKPEIEALQAALVADPPTATANDLAARIAAVTVQAYDAGKAAAEEAASTAVLKATWIPVNALDMTTKEKPHYFAKLFKAKDAKLLGLIYYRLYSALEGEANQIMGKAMKSV